MKHHKTQSKGILKLIMSGALTLGLISPTASNAGQAGDDLMTVTIIGAVGSLVYACTQEKAPCSTDHGLDTDKLSISLDHGVDGAASHVRLAVGADWKEAIYETDSWEMAGRLEGSIHSWQESTTTTKGDSGIIIGITPVFQYQPKGMEYTPFLELGTGPHFISQTNLAKEFKATQFQFGNILGLGIRNKDGFEIGYRYLHISNAGIEEPNPGTDFHNLHLGYKF